MNQKKIKDFLVLTTYFSFNTFIIYKYITHLEIKKHVRNNISN